MNWEMVGAVGEVLGAAGVIVTLVYLASQIRVSNRAARSAAMQELLDETLHLMSQLSNDGELAAIWAKGSADFNSLDMQEQVRLRAFFYQLVLIWERFYHLERAGMIDAWITNHMRKARRDVAGAPGFQTYFQQRQHWIGEEFRAVLEDDMARSDGFVAHTESDGTGAVIGSRRPAV